ncbi:helical backbone metal receptor [Iamia majanohamensis]|uniref:Helical backbone metal receptor n=1 Tax=Iamia majanohamensis TaxID=467976 RepID=A0AAE9YAK6_9ACTN|nr:helical backbone metal receptor [Iamia majanohamensis]WCO65462.1 helical backbone metal receptor [Iamia majanohamensis]
MAPRVVSLVPSVTETLVAWDRPPIACTRFCEQPGIEPVGGTKRPRLARVEELAPDLVVMNDEENRREDFEALEAAGLAVHVASPREVADVPGVLAALATAVDAPAPAPWEPPAPPDRPRRTAFVPVWARPWMTLNRDTYGASVLAAAGWAGAWDDDATRYPEVTEDEVRARAPDAVLAPTEPWAFTSEDLDDLTATFGAPAVLVDGQDLFWWGVRTPGAVARLRAALGG